MSEQTITTSHGFLVDGRRLEIGDKMFVSGMPVYSFWQKVWSLLRWHYWPKDRNGEFVVTSTTTATKLD